MSKQLDEYKMALRSADNHNHEMQAKLEIVTEQRDKLAVALVGIKNELGVVQPEYPAPVANAVKIADAALQPLTNPKPMTRDELYSILENFAISEEDAQEKLALIWGQPFDGETQKITEKDEGESKYLKWCKTRSAEDHASYRRLLD